MDDTELRLLCIQEAIKLNSIGFYHTKEDVLEMAQKLYEFAIGKK